MLVSTQIIHATCPPNKDCENDTQTQAIKIIDVFLDNAKHQTQNQQEKQILSDLGNIKDYVKTTKNWTDTQKNQFMNDLQGIINQDKLTQAININEAGKIVTKENFEKVININELKKIEQNGDQELSEQQLKKLVNVNQAKKILTLTNLKKVVNINKLKDIINVNNMKKMVTKYKLNNLITTNQPAEKQKATKLINQTKNPATKDNQNKQPTKKTTQTKRKKNILIPIILGSTLIIGLVTGLVLYNKKKQNK